MKQFELENYLPKAIVLKNHGPARLECGIRTIFGKREYCASYRDNYNGSHYFTSCSNWENVALELKKKLETDNLFFFQSNIDRP